MVSFKNFVGVETSKEIVLVSPLTALTVLLIVYFVTKPVVGAVESILEESLSFEPLIVKSTISKVSNFKLVSILEVTWIPAPNAPAVA